MWIKTFKKRDNILLMKRLNTRTILGAGKYSDDANLLLHRTPVFNICERIIILKLSMGFNRPFSS